MAMAVYPFIATSNVDHGCNLLSNGMEKSYGSYSRWSNVSTLTGNFPVSNAAHVRGYINSVACNYHQLQGLPVNTGVLKLCWLKSWFLSKVQAHKSSSQPRPGNQFMGLETRSKDSTSDTPESLSALQEKKNEPVSLSAIEGNVAEELGVTVSSRPQKTDGAEHLNNSGVPAATIGNDLPLPEKHFQIFTEAPDPALCIAVIGATGELARNKIFPALFALYYSGCLPKNVGIFGYSRSHLTNEDLRSMIAGSLTCRIDHQ
eukprot:Gb_07750 [translate_table: standard]